MIDKKISADLQKAIDTIEGYFEYHGEEIDPFQAAQIVALTFQAAAFTNYEAGKDAVEESLNKFKDIVDEHGQAFTSEFVQCLPNVVRRI